MNYSTKTLTICVSLFLMIFLASCSKDDPKTALDFLTEKDCWKISKFEIQDLETGVYIDATNEFLEPCTLDDCLSFNKNNNVLTIDEGATKCDPSDDQTYVGTWTLSNDNKTLTQTFDGESEVSTIESINENQIILSSVTDFIGVDLTIRITLN